MRLSFTSVPVQFFLPLPTSSLMTRQGNGAPPLLYSRTLQRERFGVELTYGKTEARTFPESLSSNCLKVPPR